MTSDPSQVIIGLPQQPAFAIPQQQQPQSTIGTGAPQHQPQLHSPPAPVILRNDDALLGGSFTTGQPSAAPPQALPTMVSLQLDLPKQQSTFPTTTASAQAQAPSAPSTSIVVAPTPASMPMGHWQQHQQPIFAPQFSHFPPQQAGTMMTLVPVQQQPTAQLGPGAMVSFEHQHQQQQQQQPQLMVQHAQLGQLGAAPIYHHHHHQHHQQQFQLAPASSPPQSHQYHHHHHQHHSHHPRTTGGPYRPTTTAHHHHRSSWPPRTEQPPPEHHPGDARHTDARTATKFIINGLDKRIDSAYLANVLQPYHVTRVHVVGERAGRIRGFAYVDFPSPEEAQRCVREMNGRRILDGYIKIHVSRHDCGEGGQ